MGLVVKYGSTGQAYITDSCDVDVLLAIIWNNTVEVIDTNFFGKHFPLANLPMHPSTNAPPSYPHTRRDPKTPGILGGVFVSDKLCWNSKCPDSLLSFCKTVECI